MRSAQQDGIWTNARIVPRGNPDQTFEHAALVVRDGVIAWLGRIDALPEEFSGQMPLHDVGDRWITPGLIDCHTHLVYGGNRADEFALRLAGVSYEDIAERGGGIVSTVHSTRVADEVSLYVQAAQRLQALLAEGVTTIEIKSGYGLDLASERKILRVARQLGAHFPVTVYTTFLGAHALPPEYKGRADDYIALVCDVMLPALHADGLIDAVDVFCENIGFSVAQSERVFEAATRLGLPVKMHAEQLSNLGGTQLATRYRAVSVDHLEYLNEQDILAMKQSGTAAVLLPGAFYFLREQQLPPIALLRSHGIPMAIATDSNPGTSPTTSLLLMLNMACTLFRLTVAEALTGVTTHAAQALGKPRFTAYWRRDAPPTSRSGRSIPWRSSLIAPAITPAAAWCATASPFSINKDKLMTMHRLLAEYALLPDGWKKDVLFEWDATGCLRKVSVDQPSAIAPKAAGIVLPGMANLHSHAFQRAMSGMTEYRANPTDSFWSWRTLMYDFAQKLTPAALQAVALQLYIEMLKAGYTSVCEFHYLHHDIGGNPYADPGEMSACLIAAAEEAGIGLTLLPVMYQYSGFGSKPSHAGQARFVNSPEWMIDLLQRLQRTHPQHAGLRYGVAPHSLRAVSPESLQTLLSALHQIDHHAPIHMHIAEQVQEVEDCIAFCGARPVAWLLDHAPVDRHWCLVHATHMTEAETVSLARSDAVAGICPTTEANLGDGIFNGVLYANAGGSWGIGSDSHASTCMREELRLYEYSQRLQHRQRNVLIGNVGISVGAYLYNQALAGGANASGRPIAGLAVGQRADLIVLDDQHPDLYGKHGDALLDNLIFANHGASPMRDVMAGGKWVVRQGQHADEEAAAAAYRNALHGLLKA